MKSKILILITLMAALFYSSGFSANTSTEPFSASNKKNYLKEYYINGSLKAEGWETGSFKTDYWYFYHPNGKIAGKGNFRSNKKDGYWYYYSENGTLLKEGHYKHGVALDWWIFYDIATKTEKRFQYKKNQKNGYALIYINKRLKRAEKYENNNKIGEWTSVFSFKRDNPDVSL